MRKVPPAPDFNIRAHEEQHDEEVAGIGIKQARSLMGAAGNERYYFPFVAAQRAEILTVGNGVMRGVPHWVGRSLTVEALYAEVTGAAGAGGVCRFGIYKGAEEYGWYPKELVVDAGTDVTTVATIIGKTGLGVELEGGNWYWTVAVPQGSPAPAPNMFGLYPYIGGTVDMNALFSSIFGSTQQLCTTVGIRSSGVTGALPDPWPLDATDGHNVDDVDTILTFYSVLETGLGGD
jgi:hypothetical protein